MEKDRETLLRYLPEGWEEAAKREGALQRSRIFYRDGKGAPHPVRIVAMRKDDPSTQKANRKLARKTSQKQKNTPKPQTQEMAGYIILATSLSSTATQVLELYRARWQIEQVFHRLKGLFSFGEPPGKNPDSVKAWFYGKLLAPSCARPWRKNSLFPPTEQAPVLTKDRSLWREYQIILLLLTDLLLNARRSMPLTEFLPQLPELCRASKRKRSLTLSRLLAA